MVFIDRADPSIKRAVDSLAPFIRTDVVDTLVLHLSGFSGAALATESARLASAMMVELHTIGQAIGAVEKSVVCLSIEMAVARLEAMHPGHA